MSGGLSPSRRAVKRLIDVALAVALLPAVGIAYLVLVPLIRLDSRGPAVLRQVRVGQHGQPITIYKFRTLTVGVAEVPTHELPESSETRVGRVLRSAKLDEIPQVLNVLSGDMSFVGPRPCLPSQHDVIDARRRAGVDGLVPGITGWAQLAGIDMSTPEWLAATDRAYMDESTTVEDLRVLLATVPGPVTLDRDFDHLRPVGQPEMIPST